ncbi:MAG: hypothetical protein WBB44_11605 [Candidatus Nanopelagicales bacterium]
MPACSDPAGVDVAPELSPAVAVIADGDVGESVGDDAELPQPASGIATEVANAPIVRAMRTCLTVKRCHFWIADTTAGRRAGERGTLTP